MNILDLADDLRARLREVFAEFRLPDDNPDAPIGSVSSVTIYDGFVPKTRRTATGEQEGPALPFVVVRPGSGEDADGEANAQFSTVDVDMIIAAQRIEDDGYRDVMAIIQKIRTSLLSQPVIARRYRVELPMSWNIQEDDAYPQWFGVVTARINLPQPVELNPQDVEVHYGSQV